MRFKVIDISRDKNDNTFITARELQSEENVKVIIYDENLLYDRSHIKELMKIQLNGRKIKKGDII